MGTGRNRGHPPKPPGSAGNAADWIEIGLAGDGLRLTRARQTILRILGSLEHPFTATELQEVVAARAPGIGRASVYRTLGLLEERGYVEKLHQAGSEHYTVCLSTRHHHHLTCTECGRTEELALSDDVDVLSTLDEAARKLGYVPHTHVLAVYGLCPSCQARIHPDLPDPLPPRLHGPGSRHPIGRRGHAGPERRDVPPQDGTSSGPLPDTNRSEGSRDDAPQW